METSGAATTTPEARAGVGADLTGVFCASSSLEDS